MSDAHVRRRIIRELRRTRGRVPSHELARSIGTDFEVVADCRAELVSLGELPPDRRRERSELDILRGDHPRGTPVRQR